MKELRGKVEDRDLRILYAFDPRRTALLTNRLLLRFSCVLLPPFPVYSRQMAIKQLVSNRCKSLIPISVAHLIPAYQKSRGQFV